MQIAPYLRALVRSRRPVGITNLARLRPVSDIFGWERGTPIDRRYIGDFISSNRNLIRGDLLEIGEARYSREYAARVQSVSVLHAVAGNSAATLVGDLTQPETLPAGAFDCFLCTQTLHVIFDVARAIAGTAYVLRPGGVLLATVPGISQISRYDMDRWGDYWRFTTASIRKLFEPHFAGGVHIRAYGNLVAAIALLQGIAVEDMPEPRLLDEPDDNYQVLIGIVARK
jgi:SAM-dependent methyltransferase